jgi:hypothetical protein
MHTTVPADISATALSERVIAFGRIRWVQNGEQRTDYRSALGWNILPEFLRLEDDELGTLGVEENGSFAWLLPRGTYLLHQLRWFDSWDGWHRLEPKVAFQLIEGAHAYCLGTLVVELQGKRDLIGGLWIKSVRISVEDNCGALTDDFIARYADKTFTIHRSLMIHSLEIPDRPEQLEEKDKLRDFLRAITPGLMTIPY